MKKKIIAILQTTVAIVLLAVIFYKLQHSGQLDKVIVALNNAKSNWPYLIITLAGLFMSAFFCTIRWGYLLKSQNVHIKFSKQFSLYMIGQFFSGFMLGSTGGDVVKGYYIAKESKNKEAEVIATVIVDRIAGIISLIILLSILTLFRIKFFLATPQTKTVAIFNIIALVTLIIATFFYLKYNHTNKLNKTSPHSEKSTVIKTINKLINAMHLCFKTPGVLPKVLLFSILNQLSIVMWGYYIALAIGINSGFLDILTAIVIMNTIAAIPISINGLGTRESSAIIMLGSIGIDSGTAVTFSLLCYAAIMVLSIIGGLFYLAYTLSRS